MIRTLYGRIALTFAVLMLSFGGVLGWGYFTATKYQQQELLQRLSRGLAAHIASHWPLLGPSGLDPKATKELFDMLMVVNPSIEVYLLDKRGTILSHAAPPGHLRRDRVNLAPVARFAAGADFPLVGDDPRSASERGIFSVAPVLREGRIEGYLYVILTGEDYRKLASDLWHGQVFRMAGWALAGALLLTILLGLLLFAVITRRLNALAGAVGKLVRQGLSGPFDFPASAWGSQDEIGRLAQAFRAMADRIAEQFRELHRQDEVRRELVANVCHDFRTPLTSLHGYLETLRKKSRDLAPEDRDRYLDVALRQSHKVGRLAQELFELAHLECEGIQLRLETFPLAELIQDVAQKFELPAAEKGVLLEAIVRTGTGSVRADIGLLERVLVNLLDNALRHTPAGGAIRIEVHQGADRIKVTVADSGSGIAPERLPVLFDRASPLGREGGRIGGLGLLIVQRILALHGSAIRAESALGRGSVFRFELPAASMAC